MKRRRVPPERRRLTVLPGEGRRTGRLKQAVSYYLVLGLAVILAAQAGYHWLGNLFLARRLGIVTAEPGTMETIVGAGGIITRREQVVRAPSSGVVVALHPPGERVVAGTELARLVVISREELLALKENGSTGTSLWERFYAALDSFFSGEEEPGEEETERLVFGGNIPPWYSEEAVVVNETAGLLSYHLDGWEPLAGYTYLHREQYDAQGPETYTVCEGFFLEQGEPLCKIVDNWQWYYSVILPLDPGRTMAARETVNVEFSFAPERKLEAALEECIIDASAGEVRLTYRFEEQLLDFDRCRWAEAVFSFQPERGVIVPQAALLDRGAGPGVLINRGGLVAFVPVTVLRSRGGQVLVEGLEPFSLVITRPELVREGQRLE